MPALILVDMDDTLAFGERPNEELIAKLRSQRGDRLIHIVSGRPIRRLAETREWLNANNVPHTAVHLSDFPAGPNASLAFKKYKAEKLMEEGYEISIAIDNDLAAREAYRSLGIRAVSPSRF